MRPIFGPHSNLGVHYFGAFCLYQERCPLMVIPPYKATLTLFHEVGMCNSTQQRELRIIHCITKTQSTQHGLSIKTHTVQRRSIVCEKKASVFTKATKPTRPPSLARYQFIKPLLTNLMMRNTARIYLTWPCRETSIPAS